MPKIRFQECLRSGKRIATAEQFTELKFASKFRLLKHDFLTPLRAVTSNYLRQNHNAVMIKIF